TVEDVRRAAAAAAAAQPAWAATSYQERARVMRKAADIYEAHREEFGTWTQRETGASHSKMHHESTFAYQEILNAATLPSQPYGSLMPSAVKGRLSMVRRVPAGVIGAITPWNSPSVLGMRVVAPALALGNAVVLKPDPQTPVVGGAMFAAVFAEAGLPDGLLQIVVGGADVGEAIVTDPEIGVVSFTGSTAVGRRVGQLGSGLLKKVSLELGGNNAFIVLDDADLDAAASAGAFASFQFQGQVCFAAGRHLVERRIADRYIGILTEKAKRLRLGDPYREEVQLGPIVNEKQLARVDDIVQRSIAGGARLAEGGTHEGLFYRPTVLTEVTTDLPAWTDEIFGPVAPVITFDGDDEAVALANASSYGLVASIFTRSIPRGLAIADRMRTGMIHINDGTLNDEAIIPFGGMGESGNGSRYGGEASLDTFTEWQWVTVRDQPPTFPF
ncbi:MAG TPA: aldehyde dehydrogenase family protein, partial [Candidatus Limnocylindrales bacterium]|nr:aldehyde dehydrogenase family protein [Candidatus Limnocylindrales bacterium]